MERTGGALGEAADWVSVVIEHVLLWAKWLGSTSEIHLLSLKHSQKELATRANSWVVDHRKQLATTNLASSAQMTLRKGTCHLPWLWAVHTGGEQEEGGCWRCAQGPV